MWTGITELKHLAEMNELIFDSARSPMVVSTAQGQILRVNQSVTEVFGYSRVCGPIQQMTSVKQDQKVDMVMWMMAG